MGRTIIIDCDPGLDDAIALIYAHKLQDINVLGITTVAGNASVGNTSKNALNLLESIGWDLPVIIGANGPLIKERKLSSTRTGLGNIILDNSNKEFYKGNPSDFIYEQAKRYNGDLEILALGPMTNIAETLIKYPDIKGLIKAITFMGGTNKKGNITETSEFNMYVDPDAASVVFESGIPLTMIGLDITRKATISIEEIELFHKSSTIHGILVGRFLDAIKERECFLGQCYVEVHDLVALASMVIPNIIKKKKFNVSIETESIQNLGMLTLDYRHTCEIKKNIDIAFDIDIKVFRDWMKSLVC